MSLRMFPVLIMTEVININSDIVVKCHMPHKETAYPCTPFDTHFTVCIGLLAQLSGAKAQHLTWLYKGTGTVLHHCSRARTRREGGSKKERVSSHLVVLKTPGMLLL